RDFHVTGVQTCALPISTTSPQASLRLETQRPTSCFVTHSLRENPLLRRDKGSQRPSFWARPRRTMRRYSTVVSATQLQNAPPDGRTITAKPACRRSAARVAAQRGLERRLEIGHLLDEHSQAARAHIVTHDDGFAAHGILDPVGVPHLAQPLRKPAVLRYRVGQRRRCRHHLLEILGGVEFLR